MKSFLNNLKSFAFEIFPYQLKNLLISIFNFIRSLPNLIRFRSIDISLPGIIGSNISLESSSICQLKCPICPTGKGINQKGIIRKGYLKFEDFKIFVDNYQNFKNIELSKWGEIFLNPELKQIIKYAYKKKIGLTALTGANLNNVSRDVLEALVKYEFKNLTVSIDGAKNDTYKIYRQGGDLNNVIKNIKIINSLKKKFHSEFPKLIWQFIIMGHNEHELQIAREMARELGMKFYPKLNEDANNFCVKDKSFVIKESKLGVASREDYFKKYKKLYLSDICYKLWSSPQINWDGKLLGCGENIWVDYGNVFKTSLKECLSNELYIYTKKFLLGKKKPRKDIPCIRCHNFKFIKKKPLRKIDIIMNIDGPMEYF